MLDPPSTPQVRANDASENVRFARLPRPQRVLDPGSRLVVPTKSALMQADAELPSRSLPIRLKPVKSVKLVEPVLKPAPAKDVSPSRESPDATIDIPAQLPLSQEYTSTGELGFFIQEGVKYAICARRGRNTLFMVRQYERSAGGRVQNVLEHLNHRNIAKVTQIDWEGDTMSLGLEYCRFTLREILHVHLKLEETQIQHIAASVFSALSYLARRGIAHHSVGLHSVRVTVSDLRIVLSNFELATMHEPTFNSNTDFIDLGLVLLECMEGHPHSIDKRQLAFVKAQRALNRVFGLTQPERWSGCKQLIDFLDELFNEKRSALAKISKPHQFISSAGDNLECMRPYVELVNLECFPRWVAAE